MSEKDFITLVPASPKARKFARELGVDINKVEGSERDGRVIDDDIKLFVSKKSKQIKKIDSQKNEKNELGYFVQRLAHQQFGGNKKRSLVAKLKEGCEEQECKTMIQPLSSIVKSQ